jgi:hypothetical protein
MLKRLRPLAKRPKIKKRKKLSPSAVFRATLKRLETRRKKLLEERRDWALAGDAWEVRFLSVLIEKLNAKIDSFKSHRKEFIQAKRLANDKKA